MCLCLYGRVFLTLMCLFELQMGTSQQEKVPLHYRFLCLWLTVRYMYLFDELAISSMQGMNVQLL